MTKDGLITPIRVYDVPRMSAGKMRAALTEEPYLNALTCSIEDTRTEAQYLLAQCCTNVRTGERHPPVHACFTDVGSAMHDIAKSARNGVGVI
jgi:hypothetical protein